jgi:hypothetical protein
LDLLSQLHSDLMLQIVSSKGDADEPRYLVVVGGVLNRTEAEPLDRRLLSKGLKTAHLEPYLIPPSLH